MEGILTISQREVDRLSIITQVLNKKITPSESASLLKLGERQIFRLVQRVREEGSKGVIHKNRGKKSNRGYPEKLKQRVLELYKKQIVITDQRCLSMSFCRIDSVARH